MIFQFENDDGDLLVDFLDITGLRVVTDSFSYTPLPDGTITSTFDVIMESTAETTRRAAVAQLEAKLKEVTNYHEDLLKQQAVWWRWHQDAEPPGRMLLHDFAITYPGSIYSGPLLEGTGIRATLAITHDGTKEATTEQSTYYNLISNGQTIDLATQFTTGPLHGRIPLLRIEAISGAYNEIWVGIMPAHTNISGFRPEMSCGNGTDISGDCTTVSGDKQITFASSVDLITRFQLPLSAVMLASADWTHFVGRFLVLMTYKTQYTTTETVVRLTSSIGSPEDTGLIQTQSVEYPAGTTSFVTIPLGEIQIPPGSYRRPIAANTEINLDNYSLNLEAGRINGTGYLTVDSFTLIPIQHSIYINNGDNPQPANYIYQLPDGSIEAFNTDYQSASGVANPCTVTPRDWSYPREGGTLCFVAIGANTGRLFISTRQRWLAFKS